MNLFPTKTTAERDLAQVESLTEKARGYLEVAASLLAQAHALLYGGADEVVKTRLEALGDSLPTLVAWQESEGAKLNETLASLGSVATVPVKPGREFTRDGKSGEVTVVPLPEPVVVEPGDEESAEPDPVLDEPIGPIEDTRDP